MFKKKSPTTKLSSTEMRKLDDLWALADRATSELAGSDTVLQNQIAEGINSYPNKTIVYEVVRRIRKKLKSTNPHVVMHALDLIDVLMRRCGDPVRREVGSEKFMRYMGKVCKIQRTKTDRDFVQVAHRAQDLVQEWADGARRAGAGPQSWFVATYENLRRDGVVFRDASGARPQSQFAPPGVAGRHPMMNLHVGYGGGGWREEDDPAYAAAIADSLAPDQGSGGSVGSIGDELSRVPPTVEALMDILEASKSTRELHESEILAEVVSQCRGLRESLAKKVEVLGEVPEHEMVRYLKAYDDLQTVLNLYEDVTTGRRTLPLPNTGGARRRGRAADSDDSSDDGGALQGKSSGGSGNLLDLDSSLSPARTPTGGGAPAQMQAPMPVAAQAGFAGPGFATQFPPMEQGLVYGYQQGQPPQQQQQLQQQQQQQPLQYGLEGYAPQQQQGQQPQQQQSYPAQQPLPFGSGGAPVPLPRGEDPFADNPFGPPPAGGAAAAAPAAFFSPSSFGGGGGGGADPFAPGPAAQPPAPAPALSGTGGGAFNPFGDDGPGNGGGGTSAAASASDDLFGGIQTGPNPTRAASGEYSGTTSAAKAEHASNTRVGWVPTEIARVEGAAAPPPPQPFSSSAGGPRDPFAPTTGPSVQQQQQQQQQQQAAGFGSNVGMPPSPSPWGQQQQQQQQQPFHAEPAALQPPPKQANGGADFLAYGHPQQPQQQQQQQPQHDPFAPAASSFAPAPAPALDPFASQLPPGQWGYGAPAQPAAVNPFDASPEAATTNTFF